jgi:hypothetical protein
VVKTDNLFLEQVFAEFDQLLDLFSRIFLVINVDSSKRDLQADGTLKPSAESSDPTKIVEAFTTLSMNGPLRQAYEQNRLRIHALDLMNAASGLLTKSTPAGGNERFDAFVGDLTDYLNSNEYTVEFMSDSLRQSRHLADEVLSIASEGEVRAVRDRQDELALELKQLDDRLSSAGRLLKVDWPATFKKFRDDAAADARKRAETTIGEVGEELADAMRKWSQGNESIKGLEEQHWDPAVVLAALRLATDTRARLFESARTAFGGAQPSSMSIDDLHRLRIVLPEVATAALPRLAEEEGVDSYFVGVQPDLIPVAKTWTDRLLFRRISTIRHQLFGDDLRQEIAPEVKAKRLPESCTAPLVQAAVDAVRLKFGSLPVAYATRLVDSYAEKFCAELVETIRRRREQLDDRRTRLQAEFDQNARLVTLMRELEENATRAISEIDWLAQTEHLLQPTAPIDFPPVEASAEPPQVQTVAA